MKCPMDNADLVMAERQGIEIDYCPQCRGVWLDRGELDKIIERSAVEGRSRPPREGERPRPQDDHNPYQDDDRRPYKKRKSLLGEIFDF
ncbi:MAG TPA: zf-TFIIB domain-containing protein [Rhizobiaceae bacterium]|nr:zf-TFIIB domain-containing protein [Rhizobiaceae bacterium]